ncbi:38929_t:CDS:2, partial [Gigaspora margarita]
KKKKSKTKVRSNYLSTDKEIDEIIEACIPKNTCKAMQKWVKALNSVETVTNKNQLEKEMIEFFCGGSQKFVINNKSKFSLLWEALIGKIKVLKQSKKVIKHYDPLSPDELRTIFNHKALLINIVKGSNIGDKGLQFMKFFQKNDPSGIEENLDKLIIPVLSDPEEYLEPVHNIKLYLSKRPYLDAKLEQNSYSNFMKNICSEVEINIKDHNIVNYSGRTMPIIYLFRESIPIVTSISITGYKSVSLYHSTKSNLPFYINATKKNPTFGEIRLLRSSQSNLQNVSNNEQGTMVINNYYLNGDYITINQY